jgi:hypothetical protein
MLSNSQVDAGLPLCFQFPVGQGLAGPTAKLQLLLLGPQGVLPAVVMFSPPLVAAVAKMKTKTKAEERSPCPLQALYKPEVEAVEMWSPDSRMLGRISFNPRI